MGGSESKSTRSVGVAAAVAASDVLGAAGPGVAAAAAVAGGLVGDVAGELYSTVANDGDVGKKADPVAGGGYDAA